MQNRTHKIQQGFTLIELMIVVAIIGILASIALPAYQDSTVKARVTEGLTAVTIGKHIVTDNYFNDATSVTLCRGGVFGALGAATISCDNATGVLTVTMDASAQNVALTLQPAFNPQGIEWDCNVSAAANNKFVPAECRI